MLNIRQTARPICDWCLRRSRENRCRKCSERITRRSSAWHDQRYFRTEVLSVGAAEIVRREFSRKAIAEEFTFKVSEQEQLLLSVPRLRRENAGHVYVEYRDSSFPEGVAHRYMERYATFCENVPFSLSPGVEWRRGRRGKANGVEVLERFWKGVSKVRRARA